MKAVGRTWDNGSDFERDYRPALMTFFLRRTHNYHEAEDLTQEVLARLTNKPKGEMEFAPAYIFQVAANLLRDRARKGKVRADYAEGAALAEDFGVERLDPYRVAAGRDQLKRLIAALEELPERKRLIFLASRYENLSHTMIADSFGVSVSLVEKDIRSAMAHLMKRFGAER
jgi:RNA polymerase sigma-70 factor (ECF subfamily)